MIGACACCVSRSSTKHVLTVEVTVFNQFSVRLEFLLCLQEVVPAYHKPTAGDREDGPRPS